MNIVINADDHLVELIQQYYADHIDTKAKIPYTKFVVKAKEVSVIAYQTNKVMFQGKEADKEADIWKKYLTDQELNKQTSTKTQTNCFVTAIEEEAIGSDEVGTGDYFGPVIVCACYLNQEILKEISYLNVKDSKKLNDVMIKSLAKKLEKIVPHYIYVLSNEKYNEAIKDNNQNKIKAKMHNYSLLQVSKMVNKKTKIIVDQFCTPNNYYKYLSDTNTVIKDICFETKAEDKYLVVAIASILARNAYLNEMDNLSDKYNVTLQKGASNLVDLQAAKLVSMYGFDILNKIAKLHFSNTQKIINNLKQ